MRRAGAGTKAQRRVILAALAAAALVLAAVVAPSACGVAHGEARLVPPSGEAGPAGGMDAPTISAGSAAVAGSAPGAAAASSETGSSAAGTAAAAGKTAAATRVDASSFWRLASLRDGTQAAGTALPGEDAALDALLARMRPEERLGQLFMMSYSGDEPTELLLAWIRGRGLGGVKIFGWNADDTDRLAAAIRVIQAEAARGPRAVPPLVATDQEGGWIRHVRGRTSVTPGNMAIGASAWPSDAYRSAYYIGLELSALGVTMNFAPTVDLATRLDSTIIGPRAFSSDPEETAVLAAAWARGMADSGVIATAKHYPGHGDTALDSHGILPVIDVDEETLWKRELVPYRLLAAEGVPGVMSGHLAFPKVTGGMEPASLSPKLIQGLLRDRMGYDGLVITDDLCMTGASSPGGLPETCERAIRAGNDILMFSKTLALDDESWTRLLSLYGRDEGFRARVDESARRVLRAKLRWLLPRGRAGIGPEADPARSLGTAESRAFFLEQAMRSVTVVGRPGLPLAAGGRLLVAGQFADFVTEARARYPEAEGYRFSYQPADAAVASELEGFKARLAAADTVVVCVANAASAEYARAALASGKRLYVVSALSPALSMEFASGATVTAVYSYARESFKAAFAVLSGDVEAVGRLPVSASRAGKP